MMSWAARLKGRFADWWKRVLPGSDDPQRKNASRLLTIPLLGIALIVAFLVIGSLLGIEITEQKAHRVGAEGEFFEVNDVELHARLIGEPRADPTGAPLLLIHGFTISGGHEFDRLIPPLAKERSLIIPDLLGFGHSERLLKPDQRYSRAGQADLMAHLIRRLGVDRIDLVATSYGGGVALQLALEHPELIRKLTLIDAQVDELQSAELRSLCELPLNLDEIIFWNYQGSSPISEAIALENCGDVGYCPTEAELAHRKASARVAGTTEALTAFCESQNVLSILEDLDKLQMPVFVIWGMQDEVLSDRQRQLLMEHADITKQVLLPATGHAPHLERPSLVAEILLDVFSDQAAGSSARPAH